MKRVFDVFVERDMGGWLVTSVPGLRGRHTQAQTLEGVRKAVELCMEVRT